LSLTIQPQHQQMLLFLPDDDDDDDYDDNSTHIFHPFGIETDDTWHEMAIELTQEIGRRITTITEATRETAFFFQRHSLALQKGNAVSFHITMVTE